MHCNGIVKDGVVVLPGDVQLPEGTVVRVETVSSAEAPSSGESGEASNDALYRLGDFAMPTGIPDLSVNIDHYLYGHPKRDDA